MATLSESGNTICISGMTRREMEVIKKAYVYFSNMPPEPGHPPFTVNIESTFTPSTNIINFCRELEPMCTEGYPSGALNIMGTEDYQSDRVESRLYNSIVNELRRSRQLYGTL